jgi:mycothiol synthase
MTITRHAFRGEIDIPRVFDLIRSMPLSCRHIVDFTWRLSSPTINEGRDAAFWEDENGKVVGLAAWQYYWAALDFYILPGPERQSVETDLFTWADECFRELDEERGKPLSYWAEFRDDDQERRQLIETHGFLSHEHDAYAFFEHTLVDLSPVPALPSGFTLRSLKGEQEVAPYVELHRAAFQSTSMTLEWRARTIRVPQYRPELDLVICAPNGSLAGFCVGWFEPSRRLAQIEPIGVHPRFHQHGFGRILLLEILHRFKEHGASGAIVETDLDRAPARRAYETVGFQQTHTISRKGKLLNPS